METYREFRERNGSGKPFRVPADIAERWQSRIVAQGMQGRMGGGVYMGRYGKGIGPEKLVKLALTAEQHINDWPDSDEMAQFFWETAYNLTTGEAVKVADRYAVGTAAPFEQGGAADPETALRRLWDEQGVSKERQVAVLAEIADKSAPGAQVGPFQVAADAWEVFPPHLRPGAVVTMQPTDAKQPREYYIKHAAYCGQPKRDGNRMVVFATPDAVAWQARSMQVKASPSAEMDVALRRAAAEVGPFVLDGELWWPDARGGEHRTAPQAATANVTLGQPTAPTLPVYAVFEALFFNHDLLREPMKRRFQAARGVCYTLQEHGGLMFEFLEPRYGPDDKAALMTSQQTGGREGEVWRLINSPYLGGKNARNGDLEPIVRTKYLQTRDVVVTGFTASGATKLVRAFAAIQVADPETGVPLGNVGTGFTQAQQAELLAGFAAAQAAGRSFIIEIASQGVTEFNVLWHPRFVGIKEE